MANSKQLRAFSWFSSSARACCWPSGNRHVHAPYCPTKMVDSGCPRLPSRKSCHPRIRFPKHPQNVLWNLQRLFDEKMYLIKEKHEEKLWKFKITFRIFFVDFIVLNDDIWVNLQIYDSLFLHPLANINPSLIILSTQINLPTYISDRVNLQFSHRRVQTIAPPKFIIDMSRTSTIRSRVMRKIP